MLKPNIAEISTAELNTRLGEQDPPVLIDVREDDEFAAGHIDGAIHIPRGTLELGLDRDPDGIGDVHDALADRGRSIAVYCRSGGRSARATAALNAAGFVNAVNVAGGIIAWADAGYPIQKD